MAVRRAPLAGPALAVLLAAALLARGSGHGGDHEGGGHGDQHAAGHGTTHTTADATEYRKTALNNKIIKASCAIDGWLRKPLLHRGTLIAVWAVLVLWHILRFCTDMKLASRLRDPIVHTFAVHLIVLHTYYSQHSAVCPVHLMEMLIGIPSPFFTSCCFIAIDAAVLGLRPQCCKNESYQRPLSRLKVRDRYMQVTMNFRRVSLYFFCQIALMCFFVYELNRDKDTHSQDHVSFLKWTVACAIVFIAGRDEVGREYDPAFWHALLHDPYAQEFSTVCCCIPTKYRYTWRVRMYYCWIINGVCRAMILGLSPIMLCVAAPLDFVKDCLAIFFITKLDDVENGRSLENELVELKHLDEEMDLTLLLTSHNTESLED